MLKFCIFVVCCAIAQDRLPYVVARRGEAAPVNIVQGLLSASAVYILASARIAVIAVIDDKRQSNGVGLACLYVCAWKNNTLNSSN